MYAWSIRSLARRMQYFGIQFTDYNIEVNDVEDALKMVTGQTRLPLVAKCTLDFRIVLS